MSHPVAKYLADNRYERPNEDVTATMVLFFFTGVTMISRRQLCLALAGLSLSSGLSAASYDTRIIVPYPAGGPLDAAARILAQALNSTQGKVIVENITGAAGARAMLAAKNAPADGKTWVMGAVATLAVNPLLYQHLAYSPRDFAPIALIADVPNVWVMRPQTLKDLKLKNARDVLAYLKTHPGRLNAASGGTGSAGHLALEQLNLVGLKTEHIPYAGAAPALFSVLSGETDLIFDNYANARAGIADGSLVALAVTTPERFSDLPDVPTMKELGIEMAISTWFGLLAPKDTPQESIEAIFANIAHVLKDPELFVALTRVCGHVCLEGPQKFAKRIQAEQTYYQRLLAQAQLI